MPAPFQLEVITPERTVFAGQVVSLVAPGSDGYLGVLANHAPLITGLTVGEAQVFTLDAGSRYFAVAGGFLEVASNRAVLLVEAAELAEEIDVGRAEAARQRAAEERSAAARGQAQYAEAEAALRRALNRLHVARGHSGAREVAP